jgi:hypothetical protein
VLARVELGAAAAPALRRSARIRWDDPTTGLPFTGSASIPILLLGLALPSIGLVLRRSTRSAGDSAYASQPLEMSAITVSARILRSSAADQLSM